MPPISRSIMQVLKICLRFDSQQDMKLVNIYLLLGSWHDIKYTLQAINDDDTEKSKTRYLWYLCPIYINILIYQSIHFPKTFYIIVA